MPEGNGTNLKSLQRTKMWVIKLSSKLLDSWIVLTFDLKACVQALLSLSSWIHTCPAYFPLYFQKVPSKRVVQPVGISSCSSCCAAAGRCSPSLLTTLPVLLPMHSPTCQLCSFCLPLSSLFLLSIEVLSRLPCSKYRPEANHSSHHVSRLPL